MRMLLSAGIALMGCTLILGTAAVAQQLPYGPDTCKQGFVWREAFPADHVCVTPQVRSLTQLDNANAASRKQPGGGRYGPDTCKQGYVWREARHEDHVCVTPATRTQAANDNRLAYSRQAARLSDPPPEPPPQSGTPPNPGGTGFQPGAGSVATCNQFFTCPPRMEMAVNVDNDGNGHCVCK